MSSLDRKRELNKARKRDEIVQVATRLFSEQGYASTTMSAIALEVGGSKATLWAHFPSKEDLFAAVIEMHLNTFANDVDDVFRGQTFSTLAFRRVCLLVIDCLLRENSILVYRLMVSEGARFTEISKMFYDHGPAKLRTAIATFFATCFDQVATARLTDCTIAAVTGHSTDLLLRVRSWTEVEHEDFVNDLASSLAFSAFHDG